VIETASIIAEARTWIGTPWRHQAYQKGVGCDCAGLIRGVGNALGIFDTRDGAPGTEVFAGYGRQPEPRKMLRALDQFMVRVRPSTLPLPLREGTATRGSKPAGSQGWGRSGLTPPPSPLPQREGGSMAGDVLLLRFDRDPQHLAILTGDGTIIHALQSVGKVVEHRLSPDWRARLVAAWEFSSAALAGRPTNPVDRGRKSHG
jgi:cell wall-associated NlpC family hydrolase